MLVHYFNDRIKNPYFRWTMIMITEALLILISFMIVIPSAFAYVQPEPYLNLSLKFYTPKQNWTEKMDLIPTEYYNGLKYIKFLPKSNAYCGLYWLYSGIDVYGDCGFNALIHELAHHCQVKRGDNLYDAIKHIGRFKECEDEIWEKQNLLIE